MRVLSGLKCLQTVSGRQQLVELVVEQAFLEQALNPADTDSVDRLLQCTRQALPLFSVCWTRDHLIISLFDILIYTYQSTCLTKSMFFIHIEMFHFCLIFLQKNVHSTRFVTYFCEHVLPNLSMLTSPVAELDIQLEVSELLILGKSGYFQPFEIRLFHKMLTFVKCCPRNMEYLQKIQDYFSCIIIQEQHAVMCLEPLHF